MTDFGAFMDEVFKSELNFEHDHMVHKLTQPTENLILERNARLRNETGVVNDLSDDEGQDWGRWEYCIPYIIWWKALRDGFQMTHKNKEFAHKEFLRFINTPEGKACRVTSGMKKIYVGGSNEKS